ncbi:magnesium transporter CorA family protein, partial [bacterium]|nr:magnesium transporter CorA family protein [bacterium]
DLEPMIKGLGIHPLSIEDCFDDQYLPKMDLFPDYLGVLFNDFVEEEGLVAIREINFFLGKDFLVSVFRGDETDAARFKDILERFALDNDNLVSGPVRLLHAILDRIIDNKFSLVEKAGDHISAFEDKVLGESRSADTAELHGIRQNLMVMRKSLLHERELLARICRRDSPLIQVSDLAYFSNLYDHLAKFVEIIESNRETMTNLAQIQLTLTNNAMAEASNRMNRSVNRLTLITTIFMPLSLIAGIGGMSEWTLITGPDNWKIAYPILIGAMALLGIGNYFVLRWLERKDA